MLTLTDCGCGQHQARHYALTGLTAALVARLVYNLPIVGGTHTYICEHGHTHCLTMLDSGEAVTTNPVVRKPEELRVLTCNPVVRLR